MADSPRDIHVQLIQTPQHGILMSNSDEVLVNNSIFNGTIPGKWSHPASLQTLYRGNKYYFSQPTVSWNGTRLRVEADQLQYRLYTSDGAESIVAIQRIDVKNVNDPTNISFIIPPDSEWFSSQQISIYALSDKSVKSGATVANGYPAYATLNGFKLVDPDLDVDVVRVSITAANSARMTLNKAWLSKLYFNSAFYCAPWSLTWRCTGSGVSDSSMTFVGAPTVVEAALNGMVYRSVTAYISDNITITVFDGSVSEDSYILVV